MGFFLRLAYGLIAEAFCEWLEKPLRDPQPVLFELSVNSGDSAEALRSLDEAIERLDRTIQNLKQGEESKMRMVRAVSPGG